MANSGNLIDDRGMNWSQLKNRKSVKKKSWSPLVREFLDSLCSLPHPIYESQLEVIRCLKCNTI